MRSEKEKSLKDLVVINDSNRYLSIQSRPARMSFGVLVLTLIFNLVVYFTYGELNLIGVVFSIFLTVIQVAVSYGLFVLNRLVDQQAIFLAEQRSQRIEHSELIEKQLRLFKNLGLLNDPEQKKVLDNLIAITRSMSVMKRYPEILSMEVKMLEIYAEAFREDANHGYFLFEAKKHQAQVRTILDHFVQNIVPNRAEYYTLTNLDFWSQNVLDEPDGFLETCERQSQLKEITFNRIVLMSDHPSTENQKARKDDESAGDDSNDILRRHIAVTQNNEKFKTQWCQVTRHKIFEEKGNFAYCVCENGDVIVLEMNYELIDERNGIYEYAGTKIYTINQDPEDNKDFKTLRSRYERYNKLAKPIEELDT